MISPCSYRSISRLAPWLGDAALSFLKKLSDEKFTYLDELISEQPEALRERLRNVIEYILDSSYGFHPLAAHRVLGIKHSSRLGTMVIFDNGEDYSEVAFKSMLRSACGYLGRTSLAGSRGVGVCVLKGTQEYKVPLAEVKARGFWKAMAGLQGSLPLPMGLDESDTPLVVDLANLDLLVDISADYSGMRDFMDTIVLDLVQTRRPGDVRFLSVDGTSWAMCSLKCSNVVHPDYVIGATHDSVDFSGDANMILHWCVQAKRQLDDFRTELEVRKRLFEDCQAENFELYKLKSKRMLSHWVLCIAGLSTDEVKRENPAYEAYDNIVVETENLMFNKKLSKYGMHIVHFTNPWMDDEKRLLLHADMNDGRSVGVAVTYGYNFDVSDSYKMIASDAAMRVGGGRCVYRSPLGEIVDYCQSVRKI